MDGKEPRKRMEPRKGTLLPIDDDQAYVKNKCSQRARQIRTVTPNFVFDIWFDQHYQMRTQFGDDEGIRPGIESEKVESLVNKAMNHLMSYSAILKTFTFVNHSQSGNRSERIVLQEATSDGLLNVVIEVHFIKVGTYEVTVKTAMCNENFSISDGQFALEMVEEESYLKRMERGQIKDIYNI